jgi:hypothetical protein
MTAAIIAVERVLTDALNYAKEAAGIDVECCSCLNRARDESMMSSCQC